VDRSVYGGKSRQNLSSPGHKNNSLYPNFGLSYIRASRPTKGAVVRRRETRAGMRWTRQRRRERQSQGSFCETVSKCIAQDERRQRPAKPLGEPGLSRTAKPCGPGTRCWCQAFAEDASSRPDVDASPISARRRRQEGIRLRGEHGISRQTTAQGRPGCFRLRLWFSPCALLAQCSAQGPWVPAGTRSSLRPRLSEGEDVKSNLGRIAPRERKVVSVV
jgi:hypothetical protein